MSTWDNLTIGEKLNIVKSLRWVTLTDRISKLGLKIANSKWSDLSQGARNVISRHYYIDN